MPRAPAPPQPDWSSAFRGKKAPTPAPPPPMPGAIDTESEQSLDTERQAVVGRERIAEAEAKAAKAAADAETARATFKRDPTPEHASAKDVAAQIAANAQADLESVHYLHDNTILAAELIAMQRQHDAISATMRDAEAVIKESSEHVVAVYEAFCAALGSAVAKLEDEVSEWNAMASERRDLASRLPGQQYQRDQLSVDATLVRIRERLFERFGAPGGSGARDLSQMANIKQWRIGTTGPYAIEATMRFPRTQKEN